MFLQSIVECRSKSHFFTFQRLTLNPKRINETVRFLNSEPTFYATQLQAWTMEHFVIKKKTQLMGLIETKHFGIYNV